MSKFNVTITLKAEEDPDFSKVFNVDFRSLEYIGSDLTKMLPNQLELIIFRITPFEQNKKNHTEFYTTNQLYIELLKNNALNHLLTNETIQNRESYRQTFAKKPITVDGAIQRMCDFVIRANNLKILRKEVS